MSPKWFSITFSNTDARVISGDEQYLEDISLAMNKLELSACNQVLNSLRGAL